MTEGGLLVLIRIGGRRFAWWACGAAGDERAEARAGGVEGVTAMAAVTALPNPPPSVVGVLNVRGETRVVVDPRPALGVAPVAPHPDQHLLMVVGQAPFLVWVDRAEGIVPAQPSMFDALAVDGAPVVARLDGDIIPILDARTFDPSHTSSWRRAEGVAAGDS